MMRKPLQPTPPAIYRDVGSWLLANTHMFVLLVFNFVTRGLVDYWCNKTNYVKKSIIKWVDDPRVTTTPSGLSET